MRADIWPGWASGYRRRSDNQTLIEAQQLFRVSGIVLEKMLDSENDSTSPGRP
jgi:hypothetical protein